MSKILTGLGFAIIAVAGVAFSIPTTNGGCTLNNTRPCYDKITGGSISVLKKGADSSFSACLSNSAPNEKGTTTISTALCPAEAIAYAYCYEGKSQVYMRRFIGSCQSTLPPPPPPLSPFHIVSPNGGEQIPFGSLYSIKWDGGDPSWTINLSIIQNNQVKRYLVLQPDSLANDKAEDWIADLPLGTYTLYAEACQDSSCTSKVWDYSDASFSVTAGAPLGRISSSLPTNKTIVVLSPTGNESWVASSTHDILWSGEATSSRISLSLIDYTTWTTYATIAADATNTGAFSWTIPSNIPAGQYEMYAQCTNCNQTYGYYGYSFQPFTITRP